MARYMVDVYNDREEMLLEDTDHCVGIGFYFPDYAMASNFAEQMVVGHGKAVIISVAEEKRNETD